jgi:hypothetical protein
MGRLGSVTAFTAEAALWVAGAALVAGAVGMHWSVDLPAINLLPAASRQPSSPAATTQPVLRFQAFLARPTLQFKAKLDQTLTISGASIQIQQTASGTLAYRTGDTSSSITTKVLGVSKTEDQIALGSVTYTRENGGKWTKRTRVVSDTAGNQEMLSPTQALIDKGYEVKNGVQLHRLEAADTTAFDAAMTAGRTSTDYQMNLVFWVTDDGTPAALEITGTYHDTVDEAPVIVTVDQRWTITATTGVTITAPI